MQKSKQQDGEKFGIKIEVSGARTTAYYGKMAKVAKILLSIDNHLIWYLPFKTKLDHLIHEDSGDDILYIDEKIDVDGENGDQIKAYLREGKDLILSSLHSLINRSEFDILVQNLTSLVNNMLRSISSNLTLDGIANVSLSQIDLIRLLNELWLYYSKVAGSSVSLSLQCKKGNIKVSFAEEPPFADWLDPIDDNDVQPGYFTIVTPDFGGEKNWKACLHNVELNRCAVI